jgi:fatty acid desaturase
MRVDEQQRWAPAHLGQPLYNFINACLFEYGIAAYDLELGRNLATKKRRSNPEFRERLRQVGRKIRNQALKDYVVHPALAVPVGLAFGNPFGAFFGTMAANAVANVTRNLWSHSVIMCGHFPKGVETFERTSITGETRGEWYLRQMLGSANISGSRLMHIMTGNLSHQIEHHLFPDLPASRYAEIAPKVRALFEKYELKYVTGPLVVQVASAWAKVIRLAFPNRKPARAIDHSIPPRHPAEATV